VYSGYLKGDKGKHEEEPSICSLHYEDKNIGIM
jgi:hypothetical protein